MIGICRRTFALTVVLVMAGAAIPPEAHAVPKFRSGNSLYSICKSGVPEERAVFQGYVAGVADGKLSHDDSICIPKDAMSDQVSDVVCLWLEKHPAQRHYAGDSSVSVALRDAWPCEPGAK